MRGRLSTIAGERWLLFLLSLAIAAGLWFSVKEGTRQVIFPGRPGAALLTVPVVPTLVGAPAEGFAVRGVEVRPPLVTLAGPMEVLEKIDTVSTAEVNISDARAGFTRTVELRLPPGVRSIGGPVTVNVRIGPATLRFIRETPVELQRLPDGLRAEAAPAAVAVEIEGPPTLAGALRPAELRAVVDGAALAPGTYRIRPQVQVPSGVRVVALRPPEIVVTVRRLYP
jgi:YbbR domain-containing protein